MDEMKQPETKQRANNQRRNAIALFVFAILAVIGAITVYFYIQYKNTHISTDDAFVDGHIHVVASKIPGTVKGIYVEDNQPVKEGEVLVDLDPADYEVKVNEASSGFNAEKTKIPEINARVEASKAQLSELRARADEARSMLEVRKANLEQAELDAKRAEGLFKKDAISKERYEKTMTALKVAAAQVKAAGEGVKSALSGVETQKAVIKEAETARATQMSEIKRRDAQLKDAELKYGYTKIYAPTVGYITKKNVEVGNQIQTGQPLMAVVPLDGIYITANYKETELEKVRPGQKVQIKVDTYPGKTFYGKVDSIMAGTGATFSLFPPENATGNYVKVVQRIPVKIDLDKDTDSGHVLRVGMSVEPTIIVK